MENPNEVSTSIDLATQEADTMGPVYPTPEEAGQGGGLFGWFSGAAIVNKVVEKTKVGMRTVCDFNV